MYPIRDYLGGYYMSLIHWWPLNGDTRDYIGGKHGTLVNGGNVSAIGKIGKCYSSTNNASNVSSSTDGISVLNCNLVDEVSNEYSFACWFLVHGTHGQYQSCIMSSGDWNKGNCWVIGFNKANTEIFCPVDNYNTGKISIGYQLSNNVWYHLATVYKDGISTAYLNGEAVGTVTRTGIYRSYSNHSYIGRDQGHNGFFPFNGDINDLRIYDHALSTLEVKELSKGLVVHYSFNNLADEPTFNIIGDKTLSGHGSSWTKQTETFNGHTIYKNVVTKPNTGNNAGFTHSTFAYSQKQSEQPNIYLSFWKRLNVAYGKNLGGYIRVKYTDNAVSVLPWDYNKKNWSNDEASLGKWEYVTAKVSLAAGKEVKEVVNFYVYVDQATGGDCDYACIQIEPNDHPTPYYPGIRNFDYGDESGWGHDARQVNMGYTANTNNGINAAKFNGYSSHLEFDSFKSDMFTTPYTISFWVNPTDDGRAIYFGDYETTNTSKINFERAAGGGFRYFHNSNPNKYFNTDTATPVGTWTMVTVTYTPGLMTIYINGEPKDSLSHTATLTKKDNSVMRIGMDTRADTALYGLMSDFRFYVTCLSEEDVKILYESKGAIDNQNNLFANEIVEMNSTNLVGPNTWEQGGVTDANGTNSDGMQNRIRTKHIPVMGNTTYKYSAAPGINVRGVHYYDKDMNHIGYVGSGVRTTPENCAYVRWILQKSDSSASIPVADITSYKPQMILVDTNPHEQLMTTEERYVDFNNKYTLNTKDIIEGHDVGFFKDGTASGNQFNEI